MKHKDMSPEIRRILVDATQRPAIMPGAGGDETIRRELAEVVAGGDPNALKTWRESFIAKNPNWKDDPDSLRYVGTALRNERNFSDARKCLESAVTLYRKQEGDPGSIAITLNQLAWVLVAEKNHARAWECLNEAVGLVPSGMYGFHHNRFTLASIERDETKLREIYDEMCTLYPRWFTNKQFLDHLEKDGETAFLRETPLWKEMQRLARKERA